MIFTSAGVSLRNLGVYDRSKARERGASFGLTAACRARAADRKAGRVVLFPIRYCDDFVVLVQGSRSDALSEKMRLAEYLREKMGLELSPEKTRVTALTEGFEFLGHRIRIRWDERYGYTPRVEIPKSKSVELRRKVKRRLTKRDRVPLSLSRQLQDLNPILRGWGHYFRYCTGAKDVFGSIDWYVDDRLWRWMRKKHPKSRKRWLMGQRQPADQGCRRVWREGNLEQFLIGRIPVKRYRRGWMGKPDYAIAPGELSAQRKVHAQFGERRAETDSG